MSKAKRVITYDIGTKTSAIRKKILFYYTEKFFNKWMNKYEFKGLNYQQKQFFMKKMWCDGSVAVSSIKSADKALAGLIASGVVDMKENAIIITPWTPSSRFNIYDYPTHIRLVNTRGVKFITPDELELDKEAVVIDAQKNHKSIFSSIEAKINEIVDIEMKKRVARKAQSQPWMFAFSPEDFVQAKKMQERLESDEPYMFIPLEEVDKAKSLSSGAPYIVDKFEQDRQKVENDILTMLGVNNVGVAEKKEHLVVGEINANNEDIETNNQALMNEIVEGWKRVKDVLGYEVKVIDATPVINDYNEDNKDDFNNEEDNEDGM